MSLTYATYMSQIAALMVTEATNADFVAVLPGIIDYAEQRCYRELDLLATVTRDSSATFAAGNRNLALPATLGKFVTVQEVNAISPPGAAPDNGARNQLSPVSKEVLDAVYNSSTGAGIPKFFAMLDDANIIVGPWPDQSYGAEFVGTIRPLPLSAVNTETFLATRLPDLFVAASMVFAAGYQKNFGAQADDPKMALSWELQFEALLASANSEELRKKFAASGRSSLSTEQSR